MSVSEILAERMVLAVLLVAAVTLLNGNRYVIKKECRILSQILMAVAAFSLVSVWELYYRSGDVFHPIRLILSYFSYSLKPIIALLFFKAVANDDEFLKIYWLAPIINSAVFLTSFFSQWIPGFPLVTFAFTSDNHFVRGVLYPLAFITSGVIIAGIVINALIHRHNRPLVFTVTVICVVCVNFAASILESFSDTLLIFPEIMMISLFFYYTLLCIHAMRQREREVIHQNEIDLLVSQIQPHFIYNTLNSIYHLCDIDSERAKKTIDDFSTYLRTNLSVMSQPAPIPFEKELEHTKTYLEIEKLRFGDRINTVFDIEPTNFYLPALTLQPLAENAIKHGLCQKEEGGTLTIKTREAGDVVILTVEDDGVGFDTEILNSISSSHVGYNNVKSRLERLLGASLVVVSTPGVGTRVTVKVKKHDNNS